MDSNYILNRLNSSPYRKFTVQVLKTRLENLGEAHLHDLLLALKIELHKHQNFSIHEQLRELLDHRQIAA